MINISVKEQSQQPKRVRKTPCTFELPAWISSGLENDARVTERVFLLYVSVHFAATVCTVYSRISLSCS